MQRNGALAHKVSHEEDSEDDEIELNEGPEIEEFLHEMHNTSSQETTIEGLPSFEWLKNNFRTKSGSIRYLQQLGFDAKVISKHLNIKYQHARNVMHQKLKRGPNEVYLDNVPWGCSHTKPKSHVDIILRQGLKDPNQSRVLFRVCTSCAYSLIPGVTEESVKKHLPGGY